MPALEELDIALVEQPVPAAQPAPVAGGGVIFYSAPQIDEAAFTKEEFGPRREPRLRQCLFVEAGQKRRAVRAQARGGRRRRPWTASSMAAACWRAASARPRISRCFRPCRSWNGAPSISGRASWCHDLVTDAAALREFRDPSF